MLSNFSSAVYPTFYNKKNYNKKSCYIIKQTIPM